MFKVQKTHNTDDSFGYYTADVVWEDDDGFEFVCDCGKWDNDSSRQYAYLIASLLNSADVRMMRTK